MPDLHLMVVPCLPTQSLRRGGCQGRLLLASPPTIYIVHLARLHLQALTSTVCMRYQSHLCCGMPFQEF